MGIMTAKIEHRPFTTIGRKGDRIYKYCVNRKCDRCAEKLLMEGQRETPAVFQTEQVSVMRGDDIVKIFHARCFEELSVIK